MVCFCPEGRPRGKALALAVFFAYNDRCIFMPFPGRACIRKTCKEHILYETRYQSLQCLQCILIPVHAPSYSSLLRYLSFCANSYILLHLHGKRVSTFSASSPHNQKKLWPLMDRKKISLSISGHSFLPGYSQLLSAKFNFQTFNNLISCR